MNLRAAWLPLICSLLVLPWAGPSGAQLSSWPNLTEIRVVEVTGAAATYPFAPTSVAMTTRQNPLNAANNDFASAAGEYYDVFYSDIDGTLNANGDYITIECSFGGNGGCNIDEIYLVRTGFPDRCACDIAGAVYLGNGQVPGSAENAANCAPGDHSAMGSTADNQRLRITFSFCQLSCVPAPSGMAGWWPLDGNVVPGPGRDLIHGNTAALTGALAQALELVHGSILFDGSSTRALVTDPPSGVLDFGPAGSANGNFSLDAWIHPLDPQQAGTIIPIVSKEDHMGGAGARGFLFGLNAGRLDLRLADGSSFVSLSSTLIPEVIGWRHVAVTVDRTLSPDGVKFYIDGVRSDDGMQDCTSLTGGLETSRPLGIGCWGTNHSVIFRGRIDEVEVFSRVLAEPEVRAIANARGAGKCRPPVGKVPATSNAMVVLLGLGLLAAGVGVMRRRASSGRSGA